jgi:hypothetical protein
MTLPAPLSPGTGLTPESIRATPTPEPVSTEPVTVSPSSGLSLSARSPPAARMTGPSSVVPIWLSQLFAVNSTAAEAEAGAAGTAMPRVSSAASPAVTVTRDFCTNIGSPSGGRLSTSLFGRATPKLIRKW